MRKLKISQNIFEKYPDLVLGVAVLNNIDNSGDDPKIQALLRDAEKSAIKHIGDTQLVEHPHIAPWREAYRLFGAKPKKYLSSIENLARRVSRGDQVRHINKLVDLYNLVSLKYLVPVGGEDLDKIEGDVLLTIAGDSESPVQLLGEPEARPPYPDEVIYKDDIGTICRRWNWKEADRTKLTEETKQAIIVIEGLPPVGRETIDLALGELEQFVPQFCKAQVMTDVLNKNNQEIPLA
jgi:DNA/RNA-binding domain of Phe-tRNA-synthetase-like protein